jgi:hypothetical protein
VPPAHDRAAELGDLGRTRVVLQIGAEPGDELEGEIGVLVVVDRPDDLIGVPGGADLVAGIAGIEQAEEPAASPVIEPFAGLGE